jgi:hypothetical protein
MFPGRERKFSFSVDSCKGANVVYYRVVLSEFGEIRNDSGKLSIQEQPSKPQSAFTIW